MSTEILEEYDITIGLEDDYTGLVGRPRAEEILKEFYEALGKVRDGKTLKIDFDLVTNIHFSFLDEFLRPLIDNLINGQLGDKYVVGINIEESVYCSSFENTEFSDEILRKYGLFFLICEKNGTPHWLGIDENFAPNDRGRSLSILNFLWENEKAAIETIAFNLDIPPDDCKRLIQELAKAKLVRIQETGTSRLLYAEPVITRTALKKQSKLISEEVFQAIKETNALEYGCHYVLPSGIHALQFLHFSKVLSNPRFVAKLAKKIVNEFGEGVDTVLSIATPNNTVLAQMVSEWYGGNTTAVFAHRSWQGDSLRLKEGYTLKARNVLIVVDVISTGFVVGKIVELATKEGARIRGISCVVDTYGGKASFAPIKTQRIAILEDPLKAFPPNECPTCRNNVPFRIANVLPRRI